MSSDFSESDETTSPAGSIKADDVRFEPLVPGVSFCTDPQTQLFAGYARTDAWNTPAEITLEDALEFTGLDPAYWDVTHTTAYLWHDPAQGGSVIAYEFQLAAKDPLQAAAAKILGERLDEDTAKVLRERLDEILRERSGKDGQGGEAR